MNQSFDAATLERARALCVAAHAGQKRDNGADYAIHPIAIADLLRARGLADTAILAAAYLHDVLEDTSVGQAKLLEMFGPEITELVKELTNVGPADRTFAEKQAALLEHARQMSRRAKLVKLADRRHNLSEMTVWPDWKQQRYAQATLELLEALRPWPDDQLAEEVRQAALRYLDFGSSPSSH
ncbi:MAG: HD domain-containing protein [Phycisphaerae bacterium]